MRPRLPFVPRILSLSLLGPLAACGGGDGPAPAAAPTAAASRGADGTRAPEPLRPYPIAPEAPAPPPLPAPPWAASPLPVDAAPAVVEAWTRAENRATCPPLAFAELGEAGRDARPRRASFHGGWAVAYDLPDGPGTARSGADCARCGRSAFGVAGTGVPADRTMIEAEPVVVHYADGSLVGHGAGGDGAEGHVLAHLDVRGHGCLVQVWSHHGRAHLEQLLGALRRVALDVE